MLMHEISLLMFGIAIGLQIACLIFIAFFLFYGTRAKRSIRKYLQKYEAEEKSKMRSRS